MRVLLVTPPFVQANAPYPATPLLAAWLRGAGIDAVQADLSLELLLRLFSRDGLRAAAAAMRRRPPPGGGPRPASVRSFLRRARRHAAAVGPVVEFLQGRRPGLARRILARRWLPEGPRFRVLEELSAFGADSGLADPDFRARYLASLYLDDLADAVREGLDPRFGLSRYAERLAASAPTFAPIDCALRARRPGLLDRWLDELADAALDRARPDLLALTVPFPGCLYGALRIARRAKRRRPAVPVALGGGFVNTELRELADPRFFDHVDYVCLDDGERPLERLVARLAGAAPRDALVRTRLRAGRRVVAADAPAPHVRHRDRPAPVHDGLPLARYFAMAETPNPMSRLWTERRWNKLMLAHGCYWRRCAFCDTCLDYIRRFDPAPADRAVEWIARVRAETGEDGFHFVDEAAPPALLRAVAERLLARRLRIRWWGNVRFEPHFTPGLARLLARSGCVAVTAGLECAEARLLRAMDKGVTLESAARAAAAFRGAGVLVHAYLMYGYPTQTLQETVDALEYVRQLFAAGLVQSAFWHRFALTAHSRIFRGSEDFGAVFPRFGTPRFARNEVPFRDPVTDADPDRVGPALHRAVYNYMHGVGMDLDVREWFDPGAPPPRLAPDAVRRFLRR